MSRVSWPAGIGSTDDISARTHGFLPDDLRTSRADGAAWRSDAERSYSHPRFVTEATNDQQAEERHARLIARFATRVISGLESAHGFIQEAEKYRRLTCPPKLTHGRMSQPWLPTYPVDTKVYDWPLYSSRDAVVTEWQKHKDGVFIIRSNERLQPTALLTRISTRKDRIRLMRGWKHRLNPDWKLESG